MSYIIYQTRLTPGVHFSALIIVLRILSSLNRSHFVATATKYGINNYMANVRDDVRMAEF